MLGLGVCLMSYHLLAAAEFLILGYAAFAAMTGFNRRQQITYIPYRSYVSDSDGPVILFEQHYHLSNSLKKPVAAPDTGQPAASRYSLVFLHLNQ